MLNSSATGVTGEHIIFRDGPFIIVGAFADGQMGDHFQKTEELIRSDISRGAAVFYNNRELTVRANELGFFYRDNGSRADI